MQGTKSFLSRLRVGVLMGGRSQEKEVSFNSGRTVCDHLDTVRYCVVPLYQTSAGLVYILPMHFLHRGKTTDFEHRLASEATQIIWDDLKSIIDFMYIATHGRYAEDGTLQAMLEIFNIPYLGAKVYASALRLNKIMQKTVLQQNHIKVPRFLAIYPHELMHYISFPNALMDALGEKGIQGACVVKPANEGSSLGVSVVFDYQDFSAALKKAAQVNPGQLNPVIIEEKIEGMEFTCITLQNYKTGGYLLLPPTEVVPIEGRSFFDYEQKYMPGRAKKYTPARCSSSAISKIQQVCAQVMECMEFKTISRIDGFLTENEEVVIFDPNSLSAMGPASFVFLQAAEINMSHTVLINHLIETELHNYGMLDGIIAQEKKYMIGQEKKMRVAVLMGGASNEREISLESGRNVTYKLSPQKYEVIPLFVSTDLQLYRLSQSLLVRHATASIQELVTPEMKVMWNDLPSLVDFVFIALHGGHGENGTVQGVLETLNIPYNGSGVLTSALCMNKYKTNAFLKFHGFHVPENSLLKKSDWDNNKKDLIEKVVEHLGFPLIVKPHDDGCSVMVQKATTQDNLLKALELIFSQAKESALVERCIVGTELTVGVIGNAIAQALPPSQVVTASDILSIEEKFLPGAGENQTPALLSSDALLLVQKTMERAYELLNCKGYVRIDCFYQSAEQSPTGGERVVMLEVNTLPGLTPATCIFHQAAEIGLCPMDFIDTIIHLGLEEHTQKNRSALSQELGDQSVWEL